MATKKLQILNSLIKEAQNADTLDGKHADEFALASEVEALSTKVGDTAVSDQITAAINAIEPAVTEEEVPNLYVWKKYSCTEGSVSNVTIGSGTSLTYYTKIIINDGKIDVDFNSMQMSMSSSFDINIFYKAKGNYVKVADTIYYIPENATITGNSSAVKASSAINLTTSLNYLGFVSSKSSITYPTDVGMHTDGYLYEYIKQIGDGDDNAVDSVNGKTGVVELTASDVGAVTEEEIPNLYVWKKYDGDPLYSKTSVTNAQITVAAGGHNCSIDYADEIQIVDETISLIDSKNISVENYDDAQLDLIKGKYVKYVDNIYLIPDNVTFSHYSSTYSWGIKVNKATKITVNDGTNGVLGYVSSKSFNTYPSDGEHTDGYWYKYYRQLGDSAVVDDSSINFTETDPTVPAWAKAATKPTYTASEVGALPNTTVIPDALSDLTEDSTHRTVTDTEKSTWNAKAKTSDIPTKTSQLTNDSGFATETYVDNVIAESTADWNQTDETAVNFIKNKPEIPEVDTTLLISGQAADAKVTGEVLSTKITAPTTGTVGQTIVVKAVDENGKPTEWEAVDIQKSDNKLDYVAQDTPPEDTSILWIDTSDNSDDGFQTDVGYPDWSHLKWYVIGDSLTVPDTEGKTKRYYDFVQEKTGIQIEVNGVGGTGYGAGKGNTPPNNFFTRVQNLFTEENKHILDDVDVVTIFGSGNDVNYLLSEQYSTELSNIPIWATLEKFANNKPGLRVIVVPPSPWSWKLEGETQEAIDLWKAKWDAYCENLRKCAVACNFRYVSDMHDYPPFNPNFNGHMAKFFTTDPSGIHPNEEGHKALAQYFYNALAQELEFDNGHVVSSSCGGISITGAKVGQTVMISEVDENGTPTAWEPVDLQGEKDIVIYRNQNEVPLESGSEYIVYGSGSGIVTFNIGEEWANQKYECVLEDSNSSIRLLWVQTADTQGSFITSSGTRQAIDLYGDVSKIKITSTVSIWIVIKIG